MPTGKFITASVLRATTLVFAIIVWSFFASACAGDETERMGSRFNAYLNRLPDLKPLPADQEYVLLVDYIEDAKLPTLQGDGLARMFRLTEKYTQQYLGYRVRFKLSRRIAIEPFFREKKPDFRHPVLSYPTRAWYMDPGDPRLDEKLLKVVGHALKDKSPALLARYFGKRKGTLTDYHRRIVTEFRRKLNGIHGEQDSSGRPLLNPRTDTVRKHYLSFAHWDSIAYQEKKADFLITNTIIAGPDTGMPIYVINRGGVTSAFVENSAHRPLGGVGVMGLYPFLSNGPFFTGERGTMSLAESLDAIALLLVHELGHLLMRKKEAYDLEGSIHVAPRGLDYRAWVKGIKAAGDSKSALVPTLKKY